MAYSSGVFHIDLVSGSDAARTALTSCTASNPSGTITRINKTAHGLVTGAVVDLTLFSAWLNGAYKITKVDNDNFDLDNTVWLATADASGTVTPRGGMNWADAWLTINTGATSARVQAGDEIRISKTDDPVSLATNATWTDGSATVTLASALSKKVEDAISGWTAATDITLGTDTSRKIGATAMTITPAPAFTTGKMCHIAISGGGTQDFSAYTHLNFWVRPISASAIAANTFRISLCSDSAGNTPVSTFNIPAIEASTSWHPMSVNLGSAMSASVQSVAIYAVVDPGTTAISINNIFASAGGLTLKNLIGKSGDEYYNIQSVDGVTIKIDSNNTALGGRGYSGTTSTETLYYRAGISASFSGAWQTSNVAGTTTAGDVTYSAGWNTSSNSRDGKTFIANFANGTGYGIGTNAYNKYSNFIFARVGQDSASQYNRTFEGCVWTGGANALGMNFSRKLLLNGCYFLNCTSQINVAYDVTFLNCIIRNNTAAAISATPGCEFLSCIIANNGSNSITVNSNGGTQKSKNGMILLRNTTLSDSTEIGTSLNGDAYVWSFDHDNTQGNHWGFINGATINWQTTTLHGSDPGSWKVAITSSFRSSPSPVYFRLTEIACAASALVTVKCWVKKDHATNIGASINVEDAVYNLTGVVATSATKASDTSWEELTITFTPTEAGIVPIYASTWYVAGNSNAYFGSITVTQA